MITRIQLVSYFLAVAALGAADAMAAPQGGSNGIYHSPRLNHSVAPTPTGTSLNVVTGALDNSGPIIGDWDLNFWKSGAVFTFLAVPSNDVRYLVDGEERVSALHRGARIGPDSTFRSSTVQIPAAEWLEGTDAYAGFRFRCDGRLAHPVASVNCYGYVRLTTTGPPGGIGFPATIIEYAFNGDGDAIRIPTIDGLFCAGFEGADSGNCYSGSPGAWNTLAAAPTDTYAAAMASDGHYAFHAGGASSSLPEAIDRFSRYDPIADVWIGLPDMPSPAAGMAGVYAPNTGKLYFFGGQLTSTLLYDATRIYDPDGDAWSIGAPMPGVRTVFAAAVYHNGKIYLMGGYSTNLMVSAQDTVWEYDPLTDTFDSTRAPMPQALGGAGYGVIGGHVYVAGGRNGNGVLDSLYDYDIAADNWTTRTGLPAPINAPGSAVVGGELFLFGGGNPIRMGDSATPADRAPLVAAGHAYDPVADVWSTIPPLEHAVSYPASTSIGPYLISVGGFAGETSIAATQVSVVE